MEEMKIQRQVLMSWTSNRRKIGHPQRSLRNTYEHEPIPLFFEPTKGIANTWTAQAKDEATWTKLTNTNARPPVDDATSNMETTMNKKSGTIG